MLKGTSYTEDYHTGEGDSNISELWNSVLF